MVDVLLGVLGFILYAVFGTGVTVVLGRFLLAKSVRSSLAQRTASAGTWFQFGSVWVLWPLALAIVIACGVVILPAKLVGKVTSYAFKALEGSE